MINTFQTPDTNENKYSRDRRDSKKCEVNSGNIFFPLCCMVSWLNVGSLES